LAATCCCFCAAAAAVLFLVVASPLCRQGDAVADAAVAILAVVSVLQQVLEVGNPFEI